MTSGVRGLTWFGGRRGYAQHEPHVETSAKNAGRHDAGAGRAGPEDGGGRRGRGHGQGGGQRPPGNRDRKSTRLNSSHVKTSYAVFCLKKKNDHGNASYGRP